MHAMHVNRHAQFECHSLSSVRDITIKYYRVKESNICRKYRGVVNLHTEEIMQMALIEIEPVSPTSLVGSAISGMGTYCLTSFLNDAHHSLVSTPKARWESMR